ncbi:MAG: UPF0149 family protein [Pseudomonadota bacterium]
MPTRFNYDRLAEMLGQYEMTPSAAEVQGMLTGLIASGTAAESEELMTLMTDLAYDGNPLPTELKHLLQQQAEEVQASLSDRDMGYQLLLPEDNAPLADRVQALAGWVQAFLVGFGVNQANVGNTSGDLREALDDMIEISKLEFDVEEGDDAERAYFEVAEYLRISAMMCFTELGRHEASASENNKTLH